MFMHNRRLQYTARVDVTNTGLANLLLEQFGGPQGELAAAMRYFTQAVSEDDPGRKDMLFDIATEELSHLEIIGSLVAMLNKGAKGELAEAVDEQAELYRKLHGAGNDSHLTQVLYGGGPPLVNSAGYRGPRPTSIRSANPRPTSARTSRPKRGRRSCMNGSSMSRTTRVYAMRSVF